ncbi:MAG TPA: DUF4118 domain-containing protein [Bryobacteraceae bacterium]|nr:DUF4118 domain-containing protein [Bryobacteraceae bacterium]
MPKINSHQLIGFMGQVALGSAGVAIVTAICFAAHLGFAIPCLLYMLLVVMQSLWGGFSSSAIVSIVAAVCLEYFFIPPVLEWQINDPEYGVALVTYWVTSLVITRLASRARREAQMADRRRRDAALLYEVASQLLSLAPENAAGPESLRIFREVLALRAVCFLDAESMECRIEGTSALGLIEKTKDVCVNGEDYRSRDGKLYVRCLRAAGKINGAVGFEGRFEDDAIALPLSVLAATAIERMRSFTSATKAAADAQAEMLRSAILDAFAHEFKTPLAIILTAAGSLRETTAQAEQIEMTEIIENQTVRLSQLTTRLLRTARLDRDNVTPSMELTNVNALVGSLVAQYQMLFGRGISVNVNTARVEVMADPELLSLALNQLLDNACKYSLPDTVVDVGLFVKEGSVDIRVTNEGDAIRPAEKDQIFERFVRGADTEHVTPGAGLGLYVARKIVRAHGGSLQLDSNDATKSTTFRMRLPVIQNEREYEQKIHQSVGSGR